MGQIEGIVMAQELLDNGVYKATLSETGTLWLTNTVQHKDFDLTPQASWDLLELLYQHRETLHLALHPELTSNTLPDWVNPDKEAPQSEAQE